MQRALVFVFCWFVLLAAAAACGGTGSGGGGGSLGSVIVGLTSDLRVGVDIAQIHVVMHAAGAVVKDETLSTANSAAPLDLPLDLPFDDLPGGTAVDVSIDAFSPGDTVMPLVSRLAATTVVAGKKLLLRISLDARCVVEPGSSAPTCTAPQTCAAGVCQDENVAPSTLPPYTPSWSQGSNDPCKPPDAGAPVVIVGEGQADYLPLTDGGIDQVEQGPQGGHHVWVAIRAKNLSQSGSITSVTGHFPDLDLDVGPFSVIFTMETDEGGFCKLYGLRFQLDETTSIQMLLGHPLDITVTVTDPEMAVGVGTANVVLSQTYTM